MAFVGNPLGRGLSPELFAAFAVEADDDELVPRVGVRDAEDALRLVLRLGEIGIDPARVDRCEQKNLVAPDDRRGASHLMFLLMPHLIGGLAVRETPVAAGPRHWCQWSGARFSNDSAPRAGVSKSQKTTGRGLVNIGFFKGEHCPPNETQHYGF